MHCSPLTIVEFGAVSQWIHQQLAGEQMMDRLHQAMKACTAGCALYLTCRLTSFSAIVCDLYNGGPCLLCCPVGILAAHCADHRGAKRIIMVDEYQYRLDHVKAKVPKVELVNFRERGVLEAIKWVALLLLLL